MSSVPRLLFGTALGFGLVGTTVLLLPSAAPEPAPLAEPPVARSGELRSPIEDPGHYASIVTANIFSPSRTPPSSRFMPDRLAEDLAPPPRNPVRSRPMMRLFGITKGPAGGVALIDANPRVPGAEIYRVGDRIDGAPITAITDSTVVIGRPSGPLILHLPSAAKRGS